MWRIVHKSKANEHLEEGWFLVVYFYWENFSGSSKTRVRNYGGLWLVRQRQLI